MKLTVEIRTQQSGSARYFCGVDFLTRDNQTYGGTWQESPAERDLLGAWQGGYINEDGYGYVFKDRRVDASRFYLHTVEWQPPLAWKLRVDRKGATLNLPAQPTYTWQRAPYEPMHVGLYGLTPGACFYRNLTVTGVRA